MEMKQAEWLFNIAQAQRGPAASFWLQPKPTGVKRVFLWVSVGLEATVTSDLAVLLLIREWDSSKLL